MATAWVPPGGGGEASAVAPPAKLRPSRVWYWVALAVFLAGVAWAAIAFVVIIGRVDSFQRVPFPGTGVISLARGGYVVYYEGPGSSSGGDVPQGHIDVVPVSESAAVDSIALYSGSVTYQLGSHSGTAILTLQITGPGTFRVQSTASEALPGSQLAFGSSVAGWILVAAVGASVLVLAGIAGAIVVAIIRHRRAKRA